MYEKIGQILAKHHVDMERYKKLKYNLKKSIKNYLSFKEKTKSRSKKKILIVDDDKRINDLLKDSLEDQYCVFQVFNGEEAVKTCDAIKPHLVILDNSLPDKNGEMLVKDILATGRKDTKVIFHTANEEIADAYPSDYSVHAILQKPCIEKVMKEKIRSLLENEAS